MDSSMALSSYTSRLKCSLPNPPPLMRVQSPQLPGVLPLSRRRCGMASFAEFRGLRIQMGSKMSTSLVSISTRRNPKVFSRIVSEAQETFVDNLDYCTKRVFLAHDFESYLVALD
ncbi:hypothetical protein OIU78_023038 [Salix suchowensis]|nr:hypothetical protein OIU78_023038 [Salix suchowensis]